MQLLTFLIELLGFTGVHIAPPAGQTSTPTARPYPPPRPLQPRQQACNGNPDFCNRIYSNVSWIGSHDSAFVGSIIDPRVNQEKSVTDQLNAGIRFLQAQTHTVDNGTIMEMCHTTCELLDAGSLSDYLGTVKSWLDANPDEVVTMLLVNGDNVNVGMFDAVFSSTGLKQYAFVPSTTPKQLGIADWPTYSELIANGTRLVMFLDAQANESQVPYILDEFTYFFETPYDTTDPHFAQCTLDRPANGSPEGRMYIVNHFLDLDVFGIDIPDNGADRTTNAASGDGSIGAQVGLCEGVYGRVPNAVLVDMFDRGDVFAAQNALNGLS